MGKKIKDAGGYAYLLANVEQFGAGFVTVKNGSNVVFSGAANEFIEKFADRYRWTLCALIDGNTLVF